MRVLVFEARSSFFLEKLEPVDRGVLEGLVKLTLLAAGEADLEFGHGSNVSSYTRQGSCRP